MNSDLHTFYDFYQIPGKDLFKKAEQLYEYIEDWTRRGGYTYRRPNVTPIRNRVTILDPLTGKEREMIMMGSNHYLGLADHPKLVESAIQAIRKYGVGSSGSALLTGTSAAYLELQKKVASLQHREDTVIFPSGYAANLGTIAALVREGDVVLFDKLAHASIIDGCYLSRAAHLSFRHNDMDDLRKKLEISAERYAGKLVVVEGVYSMDGDIAPIPDILGLCQQYGAKLMVDEAHALGVLGKRGLGSIEHFGLEGKIDLVMGTFSKALGSEGGYICGPKDVICYLVHYARSHFFSTSLSPCSLSAATAALDVVLEEPQRRTQLWQNIHYLKEGLLHLGFNVVRNSESAIIPVVIGEETMMRRMAQRIHEEGIYLSPIPYPAVQRNMARFRFSVMATHTREDLDQTLSAMAKVGREFGLVSKIWSGFRSTPQ
ncbi:MAG: aminotransferase class I/II-fold pyridoxal phosphate-dependent enzyme [Deltaproteobacteria bacterium]|nr:aminotransferase class I/II-fold pyridoxal phosphate-dependent enzyme [Deltaproteobacteria bacterium]